MQGMSPQYKLIDDNGMTDYLRGQTIIQQKACISDKCLGLTHVISHSEKYPLFPEKDGVYQIPKDFYEKYKRLVDMPESIALKLRKEDLRLWRKVQAFNKAMPNAKIEPMVVDYADIQADTVETTIQRETDAVEHKHQKQRRAAEESCHATLQEGIKVTLYSAALEGAVDGGISILKHKQGRKRIRDFSKEEWKDIGADAAKGIGKGAIRGAAVYTATNAINMPASVATASVTGAFTVVEKTIAFSHGKYSGEEYAYELADGIASIAVSAVSSELGKKLIPIPVMGPIIGNAVGMFIYNVTRNKIVKNNVSKKTVLENAA